MPSNLHIINKQEFDFECVHSEHAFQIEKKFDYNVQFRIAKILERACDRISVEDADIRIPLLEIDLGEISFDRLSEEMITAFEKNIYEKLSEWVDPGSGGHTGLTGRHQSAVEILLFFLLTGRLPWFAGRQDERYLAQLFEEVFTTQSETLRKFILLNLHNETFIKRLTAQTSRQQIDRVVGLLDQDIFGTQNELLKKFMLLNLGSERYIERLVNQPGEFEIDRITRLLGIDEALIVSMEMMIRYIVEKIASLQKEAGGSIIEITHAGHIDKADQEAPDDAMRLLIAYLQNDDRSFTRYIRKMALEFILKLISGNKKYLYKGAI